MTIPTFMSISLLSVVAKYFTCEIGDCSLCFNHLSTHIIFFGIVMTLYFVVQIFKLTNNRLNVASAYHDSKIIWFLVFAVVFHTFSLASSSFVEEEHQTWYYMTHSFLFVVCVMSLKKRQADQWFLNDELMKNDSRKKRISVWSLFDEFFVEFNWLLMFLAILLGRRLNQTGDKWLNLPDIGDFLVMEQHRVWNSCFVVVCEYWE